MTPFSVTTIGTGNALPDATRGPTSQLIRYGEASIVVDLGSGALQKIARAGVHVHDLDALVLTHAHIDHIADMLPLLFALSVLKIQRERPLDIYTSEKTLGYVRGVQAVFGAWLQASEGNVRWHVIAPQQAHVVAGITMHTGTVQHTESSVALRFDAPDGRKLAIPGDTAPHAPLHDFVRGVNALVIECGNPSGVENDVHLSPQSLAELLQDAQPAKAIVTHTPLELSDDEIHAAVKPAFRGSLIIPADLDTIDVA